MQKSINQDKILQQLDIEVEGSQFLQKLLNQKSSGIKDEYNRRDLHGMRLTRHWEENDTFFSVLKKRMLIRFKMIFDPDTYTHKMVKQIRDFAVTNKVDLFALLLVFSLPFTLYSNYVYPMVQRVKRMYLMQYYNKMGFIAKQFKLQTKPVSIQQLKKQILK